MPDLLQTGKIVSTHGTRGEVKILPWADSPEFLLGFEQLYIDGEPYRVAHARVHGTCVLCQFSGIDDINAAMALRNKVVSIDRAEASLPDGAVFVEVYVRCPLRVFVADLIGLRVLCGGREIGKIAEVLQPPANDVYVVRGEGGREHMIPAVREFVEEVNVPAGFVRVRLIEGMATNAD